ncbi:hypothetical protein D3C86_829780 [compost metagenome]
MAACPRAGRGARAAARALEPPPRRRGALARSADRPRAPRAADLRRHRAGLRAAAGVGGGAAEVLPRRTLHAVRRAARGLAGAAVALQRAGRFRHRRAQCRPPPRGGAGPAGLLHHHAGVPRAARAPAHAARGVPAGARRRAGRARPCRPAVRGAAGQPQGPPRSRAQPAVPGHVRRADGRRGRRARLRGRARRAARVRRRGRQVRPVAGLLHRPARRARPARIQHRPVRRHDRAAPGARLPARAAGDVGRPRPRAREPRAHRCGRRGAAARLEREPAASPVHAARAPADRSAGARAARGGRAGVRRHGAALRRTRRARQRARASFDRPGRTARHARGHRRRAQPRDGRGAAGDPEGRRRLCAHRPRAAARAHRLHAGRQRRDAAAHAVAPARGAAGGGACANAGAGCARPVGRIHRPPAGRAAWREPRLRDLHLRLHGPPQGRGQPPQRALQPPGLDAGRLHAGRRRHRAAEDAVRLRRVGVGVLLAADAGRAPRRGRARRPPRAGTPGRADPHARRDHAALRALDAAGLPRARRHRGLHQPAAHRLQRRGAARRGAGEGVRAPAGRGVVQPLRPDRGGHRRDALDLPRRRAEPRRHRPPHRGLQDLRARRGPEPGAAGRGRRAVPGRHRPGARLPAPAGPHGRALRRRPVQRQRRAPVPHGRPRALARRRPAGLPGPHRPPGEGAGLPHRARRDRGAAAGTAAGARGGRGGRRRPGRHAVGRLRVAAARCGGGRGRAQGAPGRGAARVHGAGAAVRAAGPAAQRQRQDRPQVAAQARTQRGAGLRGARGRGRTGARHGLGRGARPAARGSAGQLLRTRRRFDPEPADRVAAAHGGLEAHAAPDVRAPDRRRAGGRGRARGRGGAGRADRSRRRGAAAAVPGRVLRGRHARAPSLESVAAAARPRAAGGARARSRAGGRSAAPRCLPPALPSGKRWPLATGLRSAAGALARRMALGARCSEPRADRRAVRRGAAQPRPRARAAAASAGHPPARRRLAPAAGGAPPRGRWRVVAHRARRPGHRVRAVSRRPAGRAATEERQLAGLGA